MGGEGVAEAVAHGHGGEHGSGGAGEGFAGVVVDDVEDLDGGPGGGCGVGTGQVPVGDVGLPAFVGLFGLEADVAGLSSMSGDTCPLCQ